MKICSGMSRSASWMLLVGALLAMAIYFRDFSSSKTEQAVRRILLKPGEGTVGNDFLSGESVREMRAIGSNAIPILVSHLRDLRKPSLVMRLMNNPHVPGFVRLACSGWYNQDVEKRAAYSGHIESAMRALGSNSVPALIMLLEDPETAGSASLILIDIPSTKRVLPQLKELTRSTNENISMAARFALENTDTNSENKINSRW